jgi:hypothetical protein
MFSMSLPNTGNFFASYLGIPAPQTCPFLITSVGQTTMTRTIYYVRKRLGETCFPNGLVYTVTMTPPAASKCQCLPVALSSKLAHRLTLTPSLELVCGLSRELCKAFSILHKINQLTGYQVSGRLSTTIRAAIASKFGNA